MKALKKSISVFLVIILLFSSLSTGVTALIDIRENNYNSADGLELTPEQAATLLLDMLDENLSKNGEVVEIPVLANFDYTSLDKAIDSIYQIGNHWSLNLAGDLENLNVTALNNLRRGAGNKDLNVINKLLDFFANSSNVNIFKKVVDGSINLGVASPFIDIDDIVGDIPLMLKEMVYDSLVYREGYPENYSDLTTQEKNADALINRAFQDLLTKPSNFDAQTANNSIFGSLSSFLGMLGLPIDFSNLSVYEVIMMFMDLLGIPGIEAVPILSSGTVLLPSLENKSLINLNQNSFYKIIENLSGVVFEDLIRGTLNNSVKQLLCMISDVNLIEVTNKVKLNALKNTAPGSSNALFDADFWKHSDGNYYFRSADTFYFADESNANDFYNLFDWDYVIEKDFYNFAEAVNTYGGLIEQLNHMIFTFAQKMLAPQAFLRLDLTDGNNANLQENIEKIIKFILPISPAKFFHNDFDMSLISKQAIENKSLEEIGVVVFSSIAQGYYPQLILPKNINNLEELLVLVLREVVSETSPHLKYDDLIFDDDATSRALNMKSEQEWRELLLTMVVDLAIFFLDQTTGFDFNFEKVQQMKEQGWTYEYFLDEIVDWALNSIKGVFKAADNLQTTRGVLDGNGPWYKLNKVVNLILPLNFLNGLNGVQGGESFVLDFENLIKNKVLGNLLDLDLTDTLAIFNKNTNANNLLNYNSAMNALLTAVSSVLNSIFTISFNSDHLKTAEAFISKSSLSNLVEGLLPSLNNRKNNLIPTLLPLVCTMIPELGGEQKLGKPEIIAPDYFVWNGQASNKIILKNTSIGLPTSYVDKSGERQIDSLYKLHIKDVKLNNANISVKDTNGQTLSEFVLETGQAKELTLSGSNTTNQLLKISVDYQVYGQKGILISDDVFTYTEYVYLSTTDTDSKEVERKGGEGNSSSENRHEFSIQKNVYVNSRSFPDAINNLKMTIKRYGALLSGGSKSTVTSNGFTVSSNPTSLNKSWLKNGFVTMETTIDEPTTYIVNPFSIVAGTEYNENLNGLYTINHRYKTTKTQSIFGNDGSYSLTTRIILYNDNSLPSLYNKVMDNNYFRNDFGTTENYNYSYKDETGTVTGNKAWNDYQTALENAAALVLRPKTISNFVNSGDMNKYEDLFIALDRAVSILRQCKKTSSGAISDLQNYYDLISVTGDNAYSSVDYEMYRWNRFSSARTTATQILSQQKYALVNNKYYLPGVDLSENELNEVISSLGEIGDFVELSEYSELDLQNIIADFGGYFAQNIVFQTVDVVNAHNLLKLNYERMQHTPRDGGIINSYLKAEIDFAEAQAPLADKDNYSAVSWPTYYYALEEAKRIYELGIDGSVTQTAINKAKIELQKAYKGLILLENLVDVSSLREKIELANTYFERINQFSINKADWTALLEAKGHEIDYEGETYQLYPNSAMALAAAEHKATERNQEILKEAEDRLDNLLEDFSKYQNAVVRFDANINTNKTLLKDQSFNVTVSLSTDFAAKTISIPVYFNSNSLEVVSVNSQNASNDIKNGYVQLDLSVGDDEVEMLRKQTIATITFRNKTSNAIGGKLVWTDKSGDGILSVTSTVADKGQSITLERASISFVVPANANIDYSETKARGGTVASPQSYYDDETGKYTAADFRIITEFSQEQAEDFFNIPQNAVANGVVYDTTLLEFGTIIVFPEYVQEKGNASLTLADVDGIGVVSAKSTNIYNNEAKTDGSGYYYYAVNLQKVPSASWNTQIYTLGYVKYLDSNKNIVTVYTSGQNVVLSVEALGLK